MATFKIDDKTAKTALVGADLYLIGDSEDLSGSDKKIKKVSHASLLSYMQNNISFPGLDLPIKVATNNYTILDDDDYGIILLDGTSNKVTATLPTLADNQGRVITIMTIDDTNLCDVDGEGAETINGMTSIELPKNENYIRVVGTSTEWKSISEAISCQLRLDTYAGYGSTDTKIMQFTNSREDYGNMFSHNHGSYGTAGLEITINKSGWYSISYTSSGTGAGGQAIGLSLDSSQLTTAIQSITTADKLAVDGLGGFTPYAGNASIKKYFVKNSVIRPHTSGTTPSDSSNSLITITYG